MSVPCFVSQGSPPTSEIWTALSQNQDYSGTSLMQDQAWWWQ